MRNVRLFRLAGVPVTVSVWFFVLLGFMATTAGSVASGIAWIIAVCLSLLVHEFGHAFVAKYYGLRPSIVLHGWGGLCNHAPARTAGQDIFITAAGPGAGLLFGAFIYILGGTEPSGPLPSMTDFVLYYLYWISIVWSLANLLPLWPLDGGQIFQVVMRSRRGALQGDRTTHTVSIALAGSLLLYTLISREMFLTVLLAFLLYENIKKVQNPAPGVTFGPRSTPSASGYSRGLAMEWRPTPIVRKLLIIVGAIWLASAIIGSGPSSAGMVAGWYDTLHLHWYETLAEWHLWQLFTYMWLHDLTSLGHIFGNLFGLWILGSILERHMGGYGFLKFYLQCGVGAGLFTVLLACLFPLTFGQPVVGASGSILGLVAAISILMPREQLMLFFVVPIQAKWVIWLVLGLDTLMFISSTQSDLAWQTHVGGAFTAWLLINRYWDLRLLLDQWRLWRLRQGPRKPKRPDLRVLPGGKDEPPTLH
jgi:stage IV sporulation protein FB